MTFPLDLHSDPDNKVHRANMRPTWVLSAPDGPHVGPMDLAKSLSRMSRVASQSTSGGRSHWSSTAITLCSKTLMESESLLPNICLCRQILHDGKHVWSTIMKCPVTHFAKDLWANFPKIIKITCCSTWDIIKRSVHNLFSHATTSAVVTCVIIATDWIITVKSLI